jgi:MarR family transcriptional regulator, transcriptional regulator for hemolysin
MRRPTPTRTPTSTLTRTQPVDDTLTHWVKLAFVTMRREMEASLRKSGMTVTQWRALGVLFQKAIVTPSELVRQLEIEAPSVTSLVNGMERKGWVTRERSTTDGRVKKLHLTPRGRRMIEGAKEAMVPVEKRMAATLTVDEQSALKKLMRIMIEGMRESP